LCSKKAASEGLMDIHFLLSTALKKKIVRVERQGVSDNVTYNFGLDRDRVKIFLDL
jgi:hypothetical protein